MRRAATKETRSGSCGVVRGFEHERPDGVVAAQMTPDLLQHEIG